MPSKTFKYVYIPQDELAPMEEREFSGTCELGNDGFIEIIKKHMCKTNAEVDEHMLLNNLAEHSKRDLDTLKKEVDPTMMKKILANTSIDIFPITTPTPVNKYLAISLYVDDKGVSKNLPINKRATGMVKASGYESQEFRGDVFLSRVYDNEEEEWSRTDFTLSDCKSDAEWLKASAKVRANANPHEQMQSMSNLMAQQAGQAGQVKTTGTTTNKTGEFKPPSEDQWYEEEGFKWRQLATRGRPDGPIEALIPAPGLTKKDIKIDIKRRHLKITLKGEVLYDRDLFQNIDVDESTWVMDKENIEVTLTPEDPYMWSLLEKNE